MTDESTRTMSTAEANALNLQANGLLAELVRWQRAHPRNADCRIVDAIAGMKQATRGLQHLALGAEYPESAAARKRWQERDAAEEAAYEERQQRLAPGHPADS